MNMKVGIIGCGGIAGMHAESSLHFPEEATLTACCDIDAAKAESFAKRFGIPHWYASCEEMLANEALDACDVCTWNSAHAPCTIAALNAGCHTICEKPMAMNAQEAQAMIDAANKAGKLLMIGFIRRHGDDARTAKSLIENGELGQVYYVKAQYLRRCGFPGGWFGDKSRSGGGPLIDIGVHVIDLARYVMGGPKPVSVYGVTNDLMGSRWGLRLSAWESETVVDQPIFDVENLALAMIKFENGATLQVEASFNLNIKNDVGCVELYGDKAGLELDKFELHTIINGRNADVKLINAGSFEFGRDMDREVHNFIRAAQGLEACIAPAEDGLEIMKILDAVYLSAKTGEVVKL